MSFSPPTTQQEMIRMRSTVHRTEQLSRACHLGSNGGRLRRLRVYATATAGPQQQQQAIAAAKDDAKPLFSPVKLGDLELAHRVVMAPLTRCRAPNNMPNPDMATYYSQRASPGGLIISEATAVCPEAHGYPQVPGIHSPEQVAAWKLVVQAVKDKKGLFLCQLWHGGRASHPDYQPDNVLPVSASPIAISSSFQVYTPKGGPFEYPVPRPLELGEVPAVVAAFADAASNALAAGFDGVEIHGANGYLLDQFWKDSTNQRTDAYGGSDANKARLMLEVVAAVAAAVGPGRVGLRLSPYNTFLDAADASIDAAISKNVWLMQELDRQVPGLAYIHMVEPRLASGNEELPGPITHTLEPFRQATSRPFMAAGGFSRPSAVDAVATGKADAIAFGRQFISNPDLPRRLALDAPLNPYNRDTFYSFGREGYIDYPFLEDHV